MKRIIKYFALALMLPALNSCDSFLDTKPENFLAPTDYMKDEKEAFSMLTAVYDPLSREQLWGQGLSIYAQLDDLYFQNGTGTENQLYTNNPSSSDYRITNIWNYLYVGIGRANQFLTQIDKPEMPDLRRDQFRGEALFLRGFYYYTLVQQFGGVPLRLTPLENVNQVEMIKTPAPGVLKQVVKDMEAAEAIVGSATDNSLIGARINQSTVRGILARVYLTMAGATYTEADFNKKEMYEKALYWAYQVKKSGIHSLNNKTVFFDYDNYGGNGKSAGMGGFEYMDVFRKYIAGELDTEFKESIWEAVASGNSQDAANREASFLSSMVGAKFQWESTEGNVRSHPAWYSYGSFSVTTTIWNLFQDKTMNPREGEDLDLRRNTSCLPYTYGARTGITIKNREDILVSAFLEEGVVSDQTKKPQYYSHKISSRPVGKFNREFDTKYAHEKNRSSCNFPMLRYSDVLLMIAESALQVKALGGVVPEGIADLDQEIYDCVKLIRDRAKVTTPAKGTITLQFVKEERARELCFEGLRRQDLIRWGELLKAYINTNSSMTGNEFVAPEHQERFAFCTDNLELPKMFLLPIPATELSVNPGMEQNPGW